jgi:hypothetical protein
VKTFTETFHNWIELIKRRKAQRSYIKKLGPLLRKRYGRSRYYTVAQVQKTVQISGLDAANICYAFSEYCSEADFAEYHASTGEVCDYSSMRSEMEHSWTVGHGGYSSDSFDSVDSSGHGHNDSGHSGGHGH